MIEDARLLYDRDDFFKDILQRLKKRLSELKAKRRGRGTWHWVLKEDYKPGETIEI